jgi:hypothetical protein
VGVLFFLVSAFHVVRQDLGLATLWRITEKVIFSKSRLPSRAATGCAEAKKKPIPGISIEKLSDYKKPPPDSFWGKFPKNELPTSPVCTVNVPYMRNLLEKFKSK